MPCDSSPSARSAPAPKATPNEHGGVLDALLHYWLRRIEYADSGEARAVPEENLVGPALEPMRACLEIRGVVVLPASGDGFDFALRAATALMAHPLRCEEPLRRILAEKSAEMKLLAEDEKQSLASGTIAPDP